jgi:hypothetical protein
MKKQIQSVSLVQNAKMVAALYLVISLPLLLIFWAFGTMMGQAGMSTAMLVVFPVIYALSGFVFALIGAWIYNLVASMLGGFEFTTKEVGAA